MESKYICEPCKLSTNYKNVYEKHLTSKKHTDRMNTTPEMKAEIKDEKHVCDKCNKIYTTHCGLWKHRKKCVDAENISIVNEEPIAQPIVQPISQPIAENTVKNTQDEDRYAHLFRTDGPRKTEEEEEEEFQSESLDEQRARITVHIIQTILQHMDVTRDELNSIIDEVYLEREMARLAEEAGEGGEYQGEEREDMEESIQDETM